MKRRLQSIAAAALLFAPAMAAASPGVPDGFSVALGGDMIGPFHALSEQQDPGFARVADLFRAADLGFANQEGSILDLATFEGYPAAETGGGYVQQPPDIAGALRRMGLTIVSKANNHATDFGTEGLVGTLKNLRAGGLAEAGAGLSEAEARAPGFVDTAKGRAALVDTASTFTPLSAAGPAITRHGQTTRARPGISVLHVREVRLVSPAEVAQLRRLTEDTYSSPTEARIGDQIFRAAASEGWLWEMDPDDEMAVLSSVRTARAAARFVLFSIHAHETVGHDDARTPPGSFETMAIHRANEAPSPLEPRPADFEPILFHAVIDAGADAVVRTGPHVLEGVEIYKGRPIFYGLGGLFFDRDGRQGHEIPGGVVPFPEEQFESVVPVVVYEGGRASLIKLYPIVMEDQAPATRGDPHLSDDARAERILKRLQVLSAPFGTTIRIIGGVGQITVPPAAVALELAGPTGSAPKAAPPAGPARMHEAAAHR